VCEQGMEHLEGRGIIHRDLAARNVLGEKTLLCNNNNNNNSTTDSVHGAIICK